MHVFTCDICHAEANFRRPADGEGDLPKGWQIGSFGFDICIHLCPDCAVTTGAAAWSDACVEWDTRFKRDFEEFARRWRAENPAPEKPVLAHLRGLLAPGEELWLYDGATFTVDGGWRCRGRGPGDQHVWVIVSPGEPPCTPHAAHRRYARGCSCTLCASFRNDDIPF